MKSNLLPPRIPQGTTIHDAIQICSEAIVGNVKNLVKAFFWADTPHGYVHWQDICNGNKAISNDDRLYLSELILTIMNENCKKP